DSITPSLCPQAFLGAYEDFFVSLTPIHRLEPEGCGSCLKNKMNWNFLRGRVTQDLLVCSEACTDILSLSSRVTSSLIGKTANSQFTAHGG
ncbi:hypothetical protein LEMLEM_LOCUS16061, partial [Lemmus lemmus]